MLAALAYWGFTVGDGAGAWVLGVGAPLLPPWSGGALVGMADHSLAPAGCCTDRHR